MAELDTDTGLVKGIDYTSDATILSSGQKFGTRLFSTPSGVLGPEGPYTVYNKDTGYRYMFTSYGWLGTNYNLRVARTNKTFSEILSGSNPHKQLLDQKDRPVGGNIFRSSKRRPVHLMKFGVTRCQVHSSLVTVLNMSAAVTTVHFKTTTVNGILFSTAVR